MRKLQRLLKWLVAHVYVRRVNLNDDKEAPPKNAVEIGIKGTF